MMPTDSVQCEHQERERNRSTLQIGKQGEELVSSIFQTVDEDASVQKQLHSSVNRGCVVR